MLTNICRKSESNLSFSYENTFTEGTNLRPIEAVRCDERFLSLPRKLICLKSMRNVLVIVTGACNCNWPKYAFINFSDVCTGWSPCEWHTYMAHAVVFATIRTAKTREHRRKVLAQRISEPCTHSNNQTIVHRVPSTISGAEICLFLFQIICD